MFVQENAHYLRIALPTPLRRNFDYLPPQGDDKQPLIPGIRVQVPFQSRTMVGVLIEVVQKTSIPEHKLKPVLALLDTEPLLAKDVSHLCAWAAKYYHYAHGEVLACAMPTLLRKGKPATIKGAPITANTAVTPMLSLNAAQATAVAAIHAARNAFKVFVLHGVTGSGKTEVYLQAIAAALARDQQVLVLVPEISLTPQTVARFTARFAVPVVALHSNLTERARLNAWLAARDGSAKIVIGTRSAIFTSFHHLGLIIVDEEHDPSFKQQDRFRYHARDLAVIRAQYNQIPLVLGSATPSLESLLNVRKGRYELLSLPERAGGAELPRYELINLQNVRCEEGLSPALLSAIDTQLAQNNQVLLFLNRRGFAPVLYCSDCRWIAECTRCDARLVYHHSPKQLRCHHCDARQAIPVSCAKCGGPNVMPVGLGTQRLEQVLMKHFPDTPIIRVDRDSTQQKDALQKLLTQIQNTERAILLGTQMLAKGHHFPNVTLVGVVDADSGLFSADFRAMEQMGQLLMQVAGRAGREEKKGLVLIQTRHPEHALLQCLMRDGYAAFADALLLEREQAALPPFSYLAVLRAEAHVVTKVTAFLQTIKAHCQSLDDQVLVLGPVEASLAKRKGMHCQQLIIKSSQRGRLQAFLQHILKFAEGNTMKQPVRWLLDVDPAEV